MKDIETTIKEIKEACDKEGGKDEIAQLKISLKDFNMRLDISIVKRIMDQLTKEVEKSKVNPRKRNHKEAFGNTKQTKTTSKKEDDVIIKVPRSNNKR